MAEVKKTVSTAKTETNTPASAVKTTTTKAAPKEAEVKAEAVKQEAEVKAAPAKKTTAKKTTKTAAAKTTAAKKTTSAKAPAKKMAAKKTADPTSAVYIQFNDMSVSSDGLVARVKEIWKEKKNKASDLEDIKVYVNVAESKAYYVVNENTFGSFDL